MTPLVSIVIPYFNRWDLTHARLMEVYRFAHGDYEVILVDDASTEVEAGNGAKWWQEQALFGKLRYYRNKKNIGFGQSCNNGAKLAKGEYVIFLSNDVIASEDFITDIIDLIGDNIKTLVAGRIVDWAGGWNEFDIAGKHYIIPYAEGWLLGCTKIGWKGLGGFDPIYGKFDYEDIDLSMKAMELGYNIVNLRSPKVKHLGGATIYPLHPDRETITKMNRELFLEKWSEKIPLVISH